MGNTSQLTTGSYSSTAHNDTLIILRHLSDLITLDVLAGCSVLMVMLLVIMITFFHARAVV